MWVPPSGGPPRSGGPVRQIMDRAKTPPLLHREGRTGRGTYTCTAARYRSLAVGAWAAVLIWGELRGGRSGWAIVRIAGQGDGQIQWPASRLAWACNFSDDAC